MADVALKHPVAVSSFHQHLSAARRLSSSKFWFCRPWDSTGSSSDSFTAPKFTSWKQTRWNYFQKVVCHSSLNWQYKDLLDRQCCIFRGKIVQFFSLHWLSPHIHQPFELLSSSEEFWLYIVKNKQVSSPQPQPEPCNTHARATKSNTLYQLENTQ